MSQKPIDQLAADDPETRSADHVALNVEHLKTLFPEAFIEGRVDFDVLKQLLGAAVDDREEKYGLNWHGKRRARQLALTPSTGTLRPCPAESVDWDTTQNLMIEGDNLEVLKLLQKSYAGRVKLIYIDPPYNTGKDFVYPDDFQDNIKNYMELTGQVDGSGKKISSNMESSGRFHTQWLNMIYPRLKLARNLLRSDGVIFINIDDGEVASLRQVCDEIFGPENFLANVVWQKKYAPQNDATYFSDMHDHILVYAKLAKSQKGAAEGWQMALLPRTAEQNERYINPDNDPRGPWKPGDFSVKTYSSTYDYEIVTPGGRRCTPPKGRCWRNSKEKTAELIADNRIWFGEAGKNQPSIKQFLSETQDGRVPTTWWTREECGDNQLAKKELNELMGELAGGFDTPKPLSLLTRMLTLATQDDPKAVVLDFFGGSGTIGHAVMAYNAGDGGNRRFICVQLPEPIEGANHNLKTIAELTKERLRRAAHRVRESNPLFSGDLGFRVLKLDSSNIRAWESGRDSLSQNLFEAVEHIKSDRTAEDVLFELLLKLGLDLCVPSETRMVAGKLVHCVGGGVLIACLATEISHEDVEALSLGVVEIYTSLKPAGDTTCVFRDSAFVDDVAKANVAAILNQNGLKILRSL